MQSESKVFASEEARRGFLKHLEALLRDGKPSEALNAALENSRNRVDRNGKRIGIAVVDQDAIRVENFPTLARSPDYTGLSFDLSWPGHFAQDLGELADDNGLLDPVIETNFFTDSAFSFSTASRDEMRAVCEYGRCPWQGEFDDISTDCRVRGMDRIYGQVQVLAVIRDRTPEEEDAYQLNAAIAAILVHLAFKRHIVAHGLPRPVTILVGSNEDFPFFVAPVFTQAESTAHVRSFAAEDVPPRPRDHHERVGKAAGSRRAHRETDQRDSWGGAKHRAKAKRRSPFDPAGGSIDKEALMHLGMLGIGLLFSAMKRRK